jgi:hypothetical protein
MGPGVPILLATSFMCALISCSACSLSSLRVLTLQLCGTGFRAACHAPW